MQAYFRPNSSSPMYLMAGGHFILNGRLQSLTETLNALSSVRSRTVKLGSRLASIISPFVSLAQRIGI